MLKIGLNGFGRVGRIVARQILSKGKHQLAVVNELDPDLKNLCYLLKYDTIYGRFAHEVVPNQADNSFSVNGQTVPVFSQQKTEDVPWEKFGVDVVIDATGVKSNVLASHALIQRGIPKVIITHSPSEVDKTIILGVNDHEYDVARHHVVSSSICDANAVAPILSELDKLCGIESCFITTLHPWLSYQNLLDGFVSSVTSPGHFWKDYSLGRSSVSNLIPKDTTAGQATLKVLPALEGKIDAISFRVPTHMVSASDIAVVTQKPITREMINEHFSRKAATHSSVFGYEEDHLVSIDYLGTEKSVIVDANRTKVLKGNFLKMILWYDNEWGYCSRVVNTAELVSKR